MSEDEVISFKEIIDKAEGKEKAKEFLKSLNAKEREVLRKGNSYGESLTGSLIEKMSEEGARNMIVTTDRRSKVDLNNDGIVEHGLAMSFVFPPPNAPEEVKDAWDNTIEGFSEKDKMLASFLFMSQSLNSNIHFDENGQFDHISYPGDKDYKNIFPTEISG